MRTSMAEALFSRPGRGEFRRAPRARPRKSKQRPLRAEQIVLPRRQCGEAQIDVAGEFRADWIEMAERRQCGGAYVVIAAKVNLGTYAEGHATNGRRGKSAEANLPPQRTQLTVSDLLKVIPPKNRGITLHKRLIC